LWGYGSERVKGKGGPLDKEDRNTSKISDATLKKVHPRGKEYIEKKRRGMGGKTRGEYPK